MLQSFVTIEAAIAGLFLPAVGMVLRFVLRLVYGARGPEPGDLLFSLFNRVGWLLIFAGLLLLTLVSLFALVVVLLVFAGAAAEYVRAKRDLQRDLAWSMIGHAQANSQDIAEVIRVQQERFTGMVRKDLQGLAWQLGRGDPLPDAVAVWHKAFPREAQGYAALGKQDGRVAYEPLKSPHRAIGQTTGTVGYVLWVVLAMVMISTGTGIGIGPSFLAIYSDFSMELPGATQALLDLFDSGAGALALWLLGSMVAAPLAAGGLWVLCLVFDLPLMDWASDRLFFARRRALALRLIAISAERSGPLTQTLKQLAMGHPRFPAANVAHRLRRAYRQVATGSDWQQSLANVGIIKRNELPLLRASQAAHNLPWALRAIADRAESRSQMRWAAAQQVATPAVIGLLGLVVLWLCIALFQPLVTLIEGLA